jgi:hypothetical protein
MAHTKKKEEKKPIVHCRQMSIDDKGTTTPNDDTSIQDIKVKKAECFCNRDFTVDEIKCIVQQLRSSNTIEPLFDAKNCQLPENDKTYERFTEELNKVCTKYEINTCLRKIHFLAQIAVEADSFHTTEEYDGKSKRYSPFYGRGLKQVTWDFTYLQYYDYKNGTEDYKDFTKILNKGKLQERLKQQGKNQPELADAINENPNDTLTDELYKELKKFAESIGKNLELSWDTAGWFWKKNQLAQYADTDNCKAMTHKINGGENGLAQREKNTLKLKEAFEYVSCKAH